MTATVGWASVAALMPSAPALPPPAGDSVPAARVVDVSIVVPCHGCAATVGALVQGVAGALQPRGASVEFVLVADGSDDDAAAIARLAAVRRDVLAVILPRRRGQHGAVAAGLAPARGDVVVVMDGDLQHRPEDVPRLLDALADVDVVVACRMSRPEGRVVRAGSWVFFHALSVLLGAPLHAGLSSFSALRRVVVDALPPDRDGPRHHLLEVWRLAARWRTVAVSFPPRGAGRSSYSLAARVRLAIDLWRVAWSGRRAREPSRLAGTAPTARADAPKRASGT
ncbi:MAG: glycosyltransferase [Deltaproteobacteria bacterium]|nr:glycosyltransferase [Deltaproteobacteria bacterium]